MLANAQPETTLKSPKTRPLLAIQMRLSTHTAVPPTGAVRRHSIGGWHLLGLQAIGGSDID
jgi:hypothetical protein